MGEDKGWREARKEEKGGGERKGEGRGEEGMEEREGFRPT